MKWNWFFAITTIFGLILTIPSTIASAIAISGCAKITINFPNLVFSIPSSPLFLLILIFYFCSLFMILIIRLYESNINKKNIIETSRNRKTEGVVLLTISLILWATFYLPWAFILIENSNISKILFGLTIGPFLLLLTSFSIYELIKPYRDKMPH